ncbi:MAG TPA: response regulator transcription factor [Burkholderiaceae bacterium]|nr:response regulator transcription factor [Burkholderiaceae bacterium]HNG78899.1 response regulator transcription factor [Burkholderiaceae bacterium]
MDDSLSVVLVDDHGLCRQGLSELLQVRAGMRVLGTAGNPAEALALLQDQAPDLLVMDLRMPAMDGLTLLAHLRAEGVETPAVILTMSDSPDDLAEALRAGVRGYLLKDMDPDDVIRSIRRCGQGELVIAPAMAGKLSGLLRLGQAESPKGKTVKLTEREREILQFLVAGKSNKTIARALNISHDTVKLHVRHILAKLGLSSRVEAAVFAVEHGVTGPLGAVAAPGAAAALDTVATSAPRPVR